MAATRTSRQETKAEEAEFDENAAPVVEEEEDGADEASEGKKAAPSSQSSSSGAAKKKKKGKETNSDNSSSSCSSSSSSANKDGQAADEKELQEEFASWQAKVGPDFDSLKAALRPVERYAVRIRTDIDPFYSMFFLTEQQRLDSLVDPGGETPTLTLTRTFNANPNPNPNQHYRRTMGRG